MKKILFLTGTRADYGKLKPLMLALEADTRYEMHAFVTGMHMLTKYGYTCEEVEQGGFTHIHKFINQTANDGMDRILSKTIEGMSDYVREIKPDLIVVHGDRVETLAGAIVGALNNVLTAHIEGGEVSGTVDELIRHAVTKLSHLHFVANEGAEKRLIQLGEEGHTIHIIGSPDIDVMNSKYLPSIDEVRLHYEIEFASYGVLVFHSVTTELTELDDQAKVIVDALLASKRQFVVIYPNNDIGSETILREYQRIEGHSNFKLFPSMRFEYFLTLLRNAEFMIGNSSAGVREAPHFGVPTVNLGTRQQNRVNSALIVNSPVVEEDILSSIEAAFAVPRVPESLFGNGTATQSFISVLDQGAIWGMPTQKLFVDLDFATSLSAGPSAQR